MKQKKLIASLHIAKRLLSHVVFGKPGHWEETELLNETAVREKKEGQQHEKEKKRGDKELIMTCSASGQESKRRQITVQSEKSRKEINIIHTMGHKARRNAIYNEGKQH